MWAIIFPLIFLDVNIFIMWCLLPWENLKKKLKHSQFQIPKCLYKPTEYFYINIFCFKKYTIITSQWIRPIYSEFCKMYSFILVSSTFPIQSIIINLLLEQIYYDSKTKIEYGIYVMSLKSYQKFPVYSIYDKIL